MKPWFLLPENPADQIAPEHWIAIGEVFGLTARELNVAILLFQNRTRASIARRLRRSPGGVRKRIDKVFAKLGVADRLGLVHRVWHVYRFVSSGTPLPAATHGNGLERSKAPARALHKTPELKS